MIDRAITCNCHECGLSITVPPLNDKQKAVCPRCNYVITTKHKNALNRILAVSITALIFLVASIPFDFLTFKASGLENKFNVGQSFTILLENNYPLLALIEFLTIFAIPMSIIASLIYLILPYKFGKRAYRADKVLSVIERLMPWAMVEIFLVGVLVSLVKIIGMADVEIGFSFIAFVLYTLSLTVVVVHIDINQLREILRAPALSPFRHREQTVPQSNHAIQHTWAYLFTATILLFPANFMPIMSTLVLGQDEPSTILGGVVLLWQSGSYPIALIIFIASVLIPIVKIFVLAWLNYSVQKGLTTRKKERVVMYRIAEFIGRWSMIDIFVVIILVCLIQLGNTMSIYPGPATTAFTAVVVVTMLAAMSFEPKLIWKDYPL